MVNFEKVTGPKWAPIKKEKKKKKRKEKKKKKKINLKLGKHLWSDIWILYQV